MENMQSLNMLTAIETALTLHPVFGSSEYIRRQLSVTYQRRLGKVAAAIPGAAELLDALARADTAYQCDIIGDTVLRCSIQHALKQVKTGTDYGLPQEQCAEVFRATVRHMEQGGQGGPLVTGFVETNRLGPESHHPWIWNEEHADDVFGRSFRFVIQENYGAPLCSPSPDDLAMLAKGAQLLEDLVPVLAASAFKHVQLIALFPKVGIWSGKASSSQFRVNGSIFLNRELIGNPWWLAEHLLHESLHQKLYDFRHGHTLLEPDYNREDAVRICSLWNAPDVSKSNHWDAHRAIAAFHVYVHLGLLAIVAEQRAPQLEQTYGPLAGGVYTMTDSRRAIERARYLGEQIQELCWEDLGEAGHQMVEWLISVLDVLDPAPRPTGSYTHLLMDLYQRQSKKVDIFLSKNDAHEVANSLKQRLSDEIESTRILLSMLTSSAEIDHFNSALAQLAGHELPANFSAVRKLILTTMLKLPPAFNDVPRSSRARPSPGAIVRDMVQQSSQHLSEMGLLA